MFLFDFLCHLIVFFFFPIVYFKSKCKQTNLQEEPTHQEEEAEEEEEVKSDLGKLLILFFYKFPN